MFNPEFLATDNNDGQDGNELIQYLQEQSPDVLQRVAKSASPDIQDIIRHNVQGLLGMLPGEQFEVKVTSSRDNFASLLASAMMTGYFLRQMEQRKELEESLFADEEMSVKSEDLNL
jgi:23S rRNA G2069 N7-methylase RlmK/C1962 C5-methylase RlmI